MTLATEIRELFIKKGFKWAFMRDGRRVLDTPTVEDVDSAIANGSSHLKGRSKDSWFEAGRLLIKNADEGYCDVYVYMGTINNDLINNKENSNE